MDMKLIRDRMEALGIDLAMLNRRYWPLYSNGEILVAKVKNQDFVRLSRDSFA